MPPRPTPVLHAGAAVAGLLCLAALPVHADVDPARMVDAFEAVTQPQPGTRRSGAKGVCASGDFVGSAEGRALSTASVFSGKPVPVIARFSVGGGNPKAPDNAKTTRGLALAFDLPGGEGWQMASVSVPVFSAATPEQLLGLLQSRVPDPATKQPDPAKVKAFAEANPEVLVQPRMLAAQQVPASYAKANYWGVNAFTYIDAKGNRQYAKWVFEPVGGTQGLTDEEARTRGADFLIDELRQRVASGPVAWDFKLQLAQPGDRIDSAVVPLPDDRRKVTVGRLTIREVSPDAGGACVNMTFNPLVLPKGIEPSSDPILLGRPAPYAVSLGRRLAEKPTAN